MSTEGEQTAPHSEIKSLVELARKYPNYIRNAADFEFNHTIGKGGFGDVWLARDRITGKEVAIKEIRDERLSGSRLISFIREVDTILSCNNHFIVPFVGFSVETPYSIFTEFVPNETLAFHLHNKTPSLKGTALTIIAMCISHAMKHIHSRGIIHRDLKLANVLLNDKFLPRLCDFGIARFAPEDSMMSHRSGTPRYMAPEVIRGTTYDRKVDVFSFAIMLYEMSENKQAFEELSGDEVCRRMNGENIRPQFTRATPSALQKMITRCWDENPAARPEFSEIWELFSSGQLLFKGADAKKVKQLAATIINDEASFQAYTPARAFVDVDAILAKLEPDTKLTLKNFDQVFKTVSQKPDRNNIQKCIESAHNEQAIAERLFERDFLQIIPDEMATAKLEFIYEVFVKSPQLLSRKVPDVLDDLLDFYPRDALLLYANFTAKADQLPPELFTPLFGCLSRIAADELSNAVALCTEALKVSSELRSEKIDFYMDTLVLRLSRLPVESKRAILKSFVMLAPHMKKLDPSSLLTSIKNMQLQEYVMSLMLRVPRIKISFELIDTLVKIAQITDKAVYVLMKFSKTEGNLFKILMQTDWLLYLMPNAMMSFRLFLIFFRDPLLRPNFEAHPNFPTFLLNMAESEDELILLSLPSIVRRCSMSVDFIKSIDRTRFFKVFFERSARNTNTSVHKNAIVLLDAAARKCFLPAMIDYIPTLVSYIGVGDDRAPLAITAFVTLSTWPESHKVLKENQMDSYFKNLVNLPDYSQLAQVMLSNLGSN